MAENSAISWTDHTFNPWMGCTKVSEACRHCYAERDMDHRYHKARWGPQGTRTVTSDANWRKPLKWDREANAAGVRKRVFCASLADVFEGPETMPADAVGTVTAARVRLFALIDATPNLDWLLLTKRPQNIAAMMPPAPCTRCVGGPCDTNCPEQNRARPNVWLGTSVENQAAADERIPHLLAVPAKVRFLSCEPLLGPVSLTDQPWWDHRYAHAFYKAAYPHARPPIDWVIAGGESGPQARPSHPDWFRSLRDQCVASRVAFHFKQHGEFAEYDNREHGMADRPDADHIGGKRLVRLGGPAEAVRLTPGGAVHALDAATNVIRLGVKTAGRLLDGREWNEFPEVSRG